MDINDPKRPSDRPVLGFGQNGQNHEHLEHLWPFAKKVFEGVSLDASVEKGQPSNTSNGLGNSKG